MTQGPGVVVVGTGFGILTHVRGLRAAGFEVVGLVGRDPEKTASRAAGASAVPTSAVHSGSQAGKPPYCCTPLTYTALALCFSSRCVPTAPSHAHACSRCMCMCACPCVT